MNVVRRGAAPTPVRKDLIVMERVLLGAGAKTACAVLLLSCSALLGAFAQAAPLPAKVVKSASSQMAEATGTAAEDPATTSSIAESAFEPSCQRPRKRLWVEGEGWVIRRVTVCY
jgi:hypothetical protein